VAFTTLISCPQLAQLRAQQPEDCIVFDCRHDLAKPEAGATAYAQSHIPGARFMHLDRDLAGPPTEADGEFRGRHPLPDAVVFAQKLAAAGVTAQSQVVSYDDSGGIYAARLWWMLRWLGHEAVAVLDGGWNQWLAGGHPVDDKAPVPAPGDFTIGPGIAGHVDVQYLTAYLHSRGLQIVDARAADRYRGENETMDPVAGHIPGALNRAYWHNLDANGRFRAAADLKEDFIGLLGNRRPFEVVHQCGSGVTACHNLLAMEIAGLSGSRLYPGSWSEWCADPSRPVATGDSSGSTGGKPG
jgi:thiosulfate/3-mercaptopyruvate sulfurtransferase